MKRYLKGKKAGRSIMVAAALWSLALPTGSFTAQAPLQTVDAVDLERYLGKWYEIASYPAWFQRGCTGTTAEYSLLPDGRIGVVNRCFKKSLDGPVKSSTGKARVIDPPRNAKLKVSFFWPFEGNYWVIDLDPDYQWAVVGVPSRKYLWILSRAPSMDPQTYQEILNRLTGHGYDPTRLIRTPQPPD